MSFETPNLPTLISRASTDLEGVGTLRRTDAAVLSRVLPAAVYGLYQYLDWQYGQLFYDTAEEEALVRHGVSRGVPRKVATWSSGMAIFKGSAGAVVPAGTRLEKDGVLYDVVEGVTLEASTAKALLRSVDVGSQGNLAAGVALQLVSPVLGVESVAVVDEGSITGGNDLEELEAYRDRVGERFKKMPHGGNADDYVGWAKEHASVTRAWCKRNWVGPGTVAVFVVNDAVVPITPSQSELDSIKSAIEIERPVTAELYVLAPVLKPMVYQVSVTPDTPAVRAAVEVALQQLHARESELGSRLLHTHITEAISGAKGETDHQLLSPLTDVVPAAGELLVYGAVQWQ